MGTRERQDRERQAVRDAILRAARELFIAEGYRNVSMRKIAERIEYSPAAIYSYFPAKDDIFFALAEEGFTLLAGTHPGPAESGDPLDEVRAMFFAYYRFAREQPEYFDLMFLDRSVPQLAEHWERFPVVVESMGMATATLQRAIDAGRLPQGTDALQAFHVLWAAVHGPAVVALCNRLSPGEDGDALARDVIDAAIAGLQAGTALRFVPICPPAASSAAADPESKETSHVSS